MKFVGSVMAFSFFLLLSGFISRAQEMNAKPLRLAVAGITHGHAGFILGRKGKTDIEIVGIYEPNQELALRYAQKYNYSPSIIYNNLGKMLDAVKPTAVAAFGSVYEHLSVVQACAPRGIHVMVEKPLAASEAQSDSMLELAKKFHIYVLTDYETAWYPTSEKTYQLVTDSNFVGTMRKVVIHDGHQGPKEIGVNKEFFDWLTDPVQNGGGALVDFGCYGANLMTYLMHGQLPISVTAVTRQFKPLIYPKVEDEATIIVEYPTAQCIIQASWNWPFNRKDMEVYGDKGYIITSNNTAMKVRNQATDGEQARLITPEEVGVTVDPFTYLVAVLNGKLKMPPYGFYSLENNMEVVKILDAAKQSARTGKTVNFK